MRNPDFDLYNIFYTVATTKNITRASEKLFISQPAISYAIKKLENELGGTLFIRTKKGVELTIDGENIFHQIKSSIEVLNKTGAYFSELKNLKIGKLRVGSDTSNITIFLTEYIRHFHKLYPQIDITIIHSDNETITDLLLKNELDIVALNLPFHHKDLKIIKKKRLKDAFICNRELYKVYKDQKITLENINEIPLILFCHPHRLLQSMKCLHQKQYYWKVLFLLC